MTHDDHEVTEASAPPSPPAAPEAPTTPPPQAEAPPGIIRTLKAELFSNPGKDFWGYCKRMWAYVRLTFIQFRNPAFSVDQAHEFTIERRGIFFPVLFRFLNPVGTTGKEKVAKLDRGYIAYTKESVALLVFTVLLQLAFKELSNEETSGNLKVAFVNGAVLMFFFASVVIFALIGRFLTRKVPDLIFRRRLQEVFVYEATMVFGFVVILMLLQAFNFVAKEVGPVGGFFLVAGFHQFYLLAALNRRTKLVGFFGMAFWGSIMAFVASMTFFIVMVLSTMGASVELENPDAKPAAVEAAESPEGATPSEIKVEDPGSTDKKADDKADAPPAK